MVKGARMWRQDKKEQRHMTAAAKTGSEI